MTEATQTMWQEKTESMLRLWTTNARLKPSYIRVCHVARGRILYLHELFSRRGNFISARIAVGLLALYVVFIKCKIITISSC
jgi:hypothetical protein